MGTDRLPAVFAPNDGQVFAHWNPDNSADAGRYLERLAAGRRALDGDIRLRKHILDGCINGLRTIRRELAALVVREVGKKPWEADEEIDYAISFLDHGQGLLDSPAFEKTIEPGRTVTEVGVGGAFLICPFNDPVAGLTRKIAPAIAAGCPAIVKPSSLAVLCAREMFTAFRHAGVGDEIQLLTTGDPALSRQVLNHDDIDIISFTGSTSVGRELAVACAGGGKKTVMELGGNCPFSVFDDADLDLAVSDLMDRKLKAAGQACSSVNRVFVERGCYTQFREKLLQRVGTVVAGPSDSGVDLGPVRTREAANALVRLVSRAEEAGERLLTPKPGLVGDNSPFVVPLTVVESGSTSLFDHVETFGPVLSIRSFSRRDEHFSRLSRERHALAAYFYSGTPRTLEPRLREMRFGSIGINSTAIQGANVPTGGFRNAGLGREGGSWGMREFLTTVNRKFAV